MIAWTYDSFFISFFKRSAFGLIVHLCSVHLFSMSLLSAFAYNLFLFFFSLFFSKFLSWIINFSIFKYTLLSNKLKTSSFLYCFHFITQILIHDAYFNMLFTSICFSFCLEGYYVVLTHSVFFFNFLCWFINLQFWEKLVSKISLILYNLWCCLWPNR